MFFTRTSHSLNISPDSTLTAKCECCDNEWKDTSIRLDDFLGNEDGFFLIGGHDFSKSANNVRITSEGAETTLLYAELQKRNGDWRTDSINLDMFIENADGSLCLDITSNQSNIEQLLAASSISEPHLARMLCAIAEIAVSQCGEAAKALQDEIHTDIGQGASIALTSVNSAFGAIERARNQLENTEADDMRMMKSQARELDTIFATAGQDWAEIQEIAARASQRTKNFQHTTLNDTIVGIEKVERVLNHQMEKTKLEQEKSERDVASLEHQLNLSREEKTKAAERAHEANARTIGFSVASVFLPFVFIPLAIQASKEMETWWANESRLEDDINRATEMQNKRTNMLKAQENATKELEKSKARCKDLPNKAKGFESDFLNLEYRISDLKKNLTDYSQKLSAVDVNAVTPLRYVKTLEEGLAMLDDAKSLRSDLLGLESQQHFFGDVDGWNRIKLLLVFDDDCR